MQLGFRGRLILGTTALVVAFVALAVTVFAVQANDFADRELARNVEAGRVSVMAAVEQRRAAVLNETRFLASTPLLLAMAEIPGVDQATLEDAFDAMQSDFGDDRSGPSSGPSSGHAPVLAVVGNNGTILGSRGGGWQAGFDLSDMPGMEAALLGQASEHVWPHQQGLVAVGIAPLIREDVLHGVLVRGEFVDHDLADRLGRVAGRDLILANNGKVLGENWRGGAPVDVDLAALTALQHATLPAAGTTIAVTVNGVRRSGLAIQLHPEGGIAFLPHDVEAILRLRDEALLLLLGVGLFITLLGVLFATRTARRLTQPLHQLMEASRRIRHGELTARVDVTREDELGRLGQSFNSMAETMQTLVGDVKEKATRAEAANRAKDGFLMSMSHELRTPLTGIQSTAELLQQFGDEASAEERKDFLATILNESERLARRIGDALEYATLAGDRTQWTLSRVDLFAVCAEARSRLASLRSLKQVDIRIAPTNEAVLRGDRERLTEAIYHVMHNAWQWSPTDSIVTVTLTSNDGDITVDIADRGPGIPPEERDKLFERFTQGGDVLTDKPQGIGIGLKIASEVAMAHGGAVEYDDRPGGGARFLVHLRRDNRPIDELAEAVETGAESD